MSRTSKYLAKTGALTEKGAPTRAEVRKNPDTHRWRDTQCWHCYQPAVGKGRGGHPFCKDHLPDNQVQRRQP